MPETASKFPPWIVTNEFAQVKLALDRTGNDLRLSIEDLTTGQAILLDAFVLSALVTTSAGNIARHLDPHPAGMEDEDL